MGKDRTRALRRSHKRRMGRKAVAAYPWMDAGRARRLADHMAHCSCYACGNPRRHFGEIPMAERRQHLRLRDED